MINEMRASRRRVVAPTWPETPLGVPLRIEDAERRFLIDQYDTGNQEAGFAGDMRARYTERVADAIRRSESDQLHLRWLLSSRGLLDDPDADVQLVLDETRRQQLEQVLNEHALTLAALEPGHLLPTLRLFESSPLPLLFALLCDWSRRAELMQLDDTWLQYAAPDKRCYYRTKVGYRALADWIADAPPPLLEEQAYAAFVRDVDESLERLSFATLLRAVYFSRSEFPDRPVFYPAALRAITDS
jgi:hypothetical protein